MAILSWRRIPLAILLSEHFKYLTQITLRPNKQLLSTLQHANQSFLSCFLVVYGLAGWTLEKNIYMNMNYKYPTTIWVSFVAQMYIFLVETYFFPIFVYKLFMVKIQNCK